MGSVRRGLGDAELKKKKALRSLEELRRHHHLAGAA